MVVRREDTVNKEIHNKEEKISIWHSGGTKILDKSLCYIEYNNTTILDVLLFKRWHDKVTLK